MKKIISVILPPFVGSLLLIGIAIYDEKFSSENLEPCEIFTLNYTDFLMLLVGFTIVGGLVQFGIVEKILKKIKIQKIVHWISFGLSLTVVFGLCFALLMWSEKLGLKDLGSSFWIGCGLAAVYVAGNLITAWGIKMKMNGI